MAEDPEKQEMPPGPDTSPQTPNEPPQDVDPHKSSRWARLISQYAVPAAKKISHLASTTASKPWPPKDKPSSLAIPKNIFSPDSYEEINIMLQTAQDAPNPFRKAIWRPNPRPPIMSNTEFDAMINKQRVRLTLLKAMLCLSHRHDDAAESHTLEAFEIAEKLHDEPTIARCVYWLGRIEYSRKDYAKAQSHFLKAAPSLGDLSEGEEIPMFLKLIQPGLTRAEQKRIVVDNSEVMLKPYLKNILKKSKERRYRERMSKSSKQCNCNEETAGTGIKRDWTEAICEFVVSSKPRQGKAKSHHPTLRYLPDFTDQHIHPGDRPQEFPNHYMVSPDKLTKLNEEKYDDNPRLPSDGAPSDNPIKPNEEKFDVSSSTPSDNPIDPINPAKAMAILDGLRSSQHRLEKTQFSFEIYPTGLAKRTPSIRIFDKLPCEILMPATDWEAEKENFQGKRITMEDLARETQDRRMVMGRLKREQWLLSQGIPLERKEDEEDAKDAKDGVEAE